jgi:hypothetical protein
MILSIPQLNITEQTKDSDLETGIWIKDLQDCKPACYQLSHAASLMWQKFEIFKVYQILKGIKT